MLTRPYKLVLFDADGTLRRCTVPNQPCPNKPGEWVLLPGVRDRMAQIDWGTTMLGIVSNQAGIALGYMPRTTAEGMLVDLICEIFGGLSNVPPYRIQICPHKPDDHCPCRKPSPYMLWRIMVDFDVRHTDTVYVGDLVSDREAAKRAGVDFELAADFFGFAWTEDGRCVLRSEVEQGGAHAP